MNSIPLNLQNRSISPKYRVNDWLRATESDDWPLRIEIFKDRLNGRFLEPIDLIENNKKIGAFAGFSIMALDCLLVETLNQFYQGLDETPGNHQKQFWKFFRSSEHFKPHFNRKASDVFYSHVRCGLLHQAQTKRGTLIRADCDKMIEPAPGGLTHGIIVDRVRFHAALKMEICSYISKLQSGNDVDAQLRKNFTQKMNLICRLKP